MNELIFKAIGGLGILLISIGLLKKKKLSTLYFHISGGVCLEIYSLHLGDPIFIILQAVFIAVASYEIYKLKKAQKKK
jgi:lipid-A-disaccharide synthase-like uncharacterized protein